MFVDRNEKGDENEEHLNSKKKYDGGGKLTLQGSDVTNAGHGYRATSLHYNRVIVGAITIHLEMNFIYVKI